MLDPRSLTREINLRRGIGYTGGLVGIGVIYFALAKGGFALASIHPSATPIWAPTGFALAVVLLMGYRAWPAIFAAALIANATTAGSIATAIAIAIGNSLEAVVGVYLINRWSNGRNTFSTPNSVARFALICVVIATPISASIGLTSLAGAGYVEMTNFANIWVTWWLGDAAGALVEELTGKLSNLPDEESGEIAIRQVYATSALYRGPYLDAAPDLIVGYNDGYRTAWDAATGKVGRHVIEDNRKAWSGDHSIDPLLVPGVLFSNRSIDAEDPGIEDMAPTVLELFGISKPEWMEGKPIFRFA